MKSLTIQKIKSEQKELATKIRENKNCRKQDKRGDRSLRDIESDIWMASRNFRHRHIAYCLLRGRTYNQIEKPSDNNKPNKDWINKILEGFKQDLAKEQQEVA